MIVMLVHWHIRKGREEEFLARWEKGMKVTHPGLFRELLTTIDHDAADPKFHTFSLGDSYYTTYLNVGIWDSVASFDEAVGKFIPEAVESVESDGRPVVTLKLDAAEFKLRERVVLRVISDRGGDLPPAKLDS